MQTWFCLNFLPRCCDCCNIWYNQQSTNKSHLISCSGRLNNVVAQNDLHCAWETPSWHLLIQVSVMTKHWVQVVINSWPTLQLDNVNCHCTNLV